MVCSKVSNRLFTLSNCFSFSTLYAVFGKLNKIYGNAFEKLNKANIKQKMSFGDFLLKVWGFFFFQYDSSKKTILLVEHFAVPMSNNITNCQHKYLALQFGNLILGIFYIRELPDWFLEECKTDVVVKYSTGKKTILPIETLTSSLIV